MIELKKPAGHKLWAKLYSLYLSAFPAAERKPWWMIRKMHRAGKTDIWCIMHEESFAGLAITINGPDTILLDYFAVEKKCRGQGIGRSALKAILERYEGKHFFLEIESTNAQTAKNMPTRLRRKAFYLSCGLQEMHTEATLFGVKMELLGNGCHLDYNDYKAFYRDNYNQWAANHITPAE